VSAPESAEASPPDPPLLQARVATNSKHVVGATRIFMAGSIAWKRAHAALIALSSDGQERRSRG
jgi:hypothetical protein